ncbi:MAG TPA: hypothetical protein VGS62_00980 [Streptosporangiaceae bacterium]|nr:hypothetical protein [Streptosporangiaceae bacterium]
MSTSDVSVSEAAGEAQPRPAAPAPPGLRRLRRWWVPAAWVAGAVVAFAVYLQLARTRAVNSDGASNALQAWDMLHGNLQLHGWSLTDVSFYTTELPQYMLVELVRGLHQDVVHVAAAMTYTLAVVMAALLAKGNATGREALVRVGIAAGIMLVPQLGPGMNILISSPDHIGTSVPVMVIWLILDRARPRWYLPVIAAVLLGWVMVADMLVLYIGVLPLALAGGIRLYRAVIVEKQPLDSQRYHLIMFVAPLVAAGAAALALHIIHASGGFYVSAPVAQFAGSGAQLSQHVGVVAEGLLLLGGADFLGLRFSFLNALIVLHVAGVALAVWGTRLAGRCLRRDRDLVSQLLLLGVVINVTIYLLSVRAHWLPATREMAPVLPLSAALAGRLLARRLMAARLVPLLLVVSVGYLIGLAHEAVQPQVPAQNQRLVSWLAQHHLHTGLSGYWESNVVTLTSGNRIQIRAVATSGGRVVPGLIESNQAWFDPHKSYANFVVIYPGVREYPGFTDTGAVVTTFGPPARTYDTGPYTVLVWNHNLLSSLRR